MCILRTEGSSLPEAPAKRRPDEGGDKYGFKFEIQIGSIFDYEHLYNVKNRENKVENCINFWSKHCTNDIDFSICTNQTQKGTLTWIGKHRNVSDAPKTQGRLKVDFCAFLILPFQDKSSSDTQQKPNLMKDGRLLLQYPRDQSCVQRISQDHSMSKRSIIARPI
uniref:Uncharacterized protein n=1 Tax=Romanomermis culicivorax TaxID=13658 RepID=A0A915IBG2_ROMCU